MNARDARFWAKGQRDVLLEIERNGLWRCPECHHPMPCEARDYNICPVCNKEFGHDAPEHKVTKRLWP